MIQANVGDGSTGLELTWNLEQTPLRHRRVRERAEYSAENAQKAIKVANHPTPPSTVMMASEYTLNFFLFSSERNPPISSQ